MHFINWYILINMRNDYKHYLIETIYPSFEFEFILFEWYFIIPLIMLTPLIPIHAQSKRSIIDTTSFVLWDLKTINRTGRSICFDHKFIIRQCRYKTLSSSVLFVLYVYLIYVGQKQLIDSYWNRKALYTDN